VNADENVALVNGKPITKSELMFIKKNQGNNFNEMLAIDNLVRMKLLAQEAMRMNINKQTDYSTRKDLAELNMLSNLMISEKLKSFKPTEEDPLIFKTTLDPPYGIFECVMCNKCNPGKTMYRSQRATCLPCSGQENHYMYAAHMFKTCYGFHEMISPCELIHIQHLSYDDHT
jgi:hypothetical protein